MLKFEIIEKVIEVTTKHTDAMDSLTSLQTHLGWDDDTLAKNLLVIERITVDSIAEIMEKA